MLSAPSMDSIMAGLSMPSPPDSAGKGGGDIRQAAQKLESLFISEMLKNLKKTLPGEGFLPKGTGSEMYEAILDTALSEGLSKRGLGFSSAFERMYGKGTPGIGNTREKSLQKAYLNTQSNKDTVGVSILA